MEKGDKGVRIVNGIRYVNNTRAAHMLNYSPQGWRKLRDKLHENNSLQLWTFAGDAKNKYMLESDIDKLQNPEPYDESSD